MSNAPRIDNIDTRIDDVDERATAFAINNLLINGDFGIWQRGDSFLAASVNDNVKYYADRMYSEARGTAAVIDVERTTDVPNDNFKYSIRYTGQETDDNPYTGQRIEADNIRPYIGKTMTFSIWVKASLTGASQLLLLDVGTPVLGEDSYDQVNSYNSITAVASTSWTASATWERRSITFVVPSNAADGLQVALRGSTSGIMNTNDTLHTTGWMLHEGTQPSASFQRAGRNTADELSMCRRYYREIGGKSSGYPIGPIGVAAGTTSVRFVFNDSKGMRTDQPFLGSGGVPSLVPLDGGTTPTFSSLPFSQLMGSNNRAGIAVTGATSSAVYLLSNSGSGFVTFDDEI